MGRSLIYFTRRNIPCWYREFIEGGSSNKNCSFRGEVGSLDEKSSFQDKHGPSLNRAHGWLCRSSLFSFFRGFAGQRSINLFVRVNFPDIRTFKIKCFFSIQTLPRPTEFSFFSKFFRLIYIYNKKNKNSFYRGQLNGFSTPLITFIINLPIFAHSCRVVVDVV